jgi:hypothetical protein
MFLSPRPWATQDRECERRTRYSMEQAIWCGLSFALNIAVKHRLTERRNGHRQSCSACGESATSFRQACRKFDGKDEAGIADGIREAMD